MNAESASCSVEASVNAQSARCIIEDKATKMLKGIVEKTNKAKYQGIKKEKLVERARGKKQSRTKAVQNPKPETEVQSPKIEVCRNKLKNPNVKTAAFEDHLEGASSSRPDDGTQRDADGKIQFGKAVKSEVKQKRPLDSINLFDRSAQKQRRRVEADNVHEHSEVGKSSVEKAKRKATSQEFSEANEAYKIQKCANHQGLEGNERHMGMCAGYACSSTDSD